MPVCLRGCCPPAILSSDRRCATSATSPPPCGLHACCAAHVLSLCCALRGRTRAFASLRPAVLRMGQPSVHPSRALSPQGTFLRRAHDPVIAGIEERVRHAGRCVACSLRTQGLLESCQVWNQLWSAMHSCVMTCGAGGYRRYVARGWAPACRGAPLCLVA